MITDLEFVEYISAKICHDLSGALGALSNGIEFVDSSDPNVQKKAIELIHISSAQAVDTIKLFRQIYGVAKNDGEADLGQLKELCQMMLKEKKINLEFLIPNSLPSERALNPQIAKLMLAVVYFAKAELIHGGGITISIHHHGDHNSINIVAQGKDMKIKSDCHKIMLGKEDAEISSMNIDSYYIRRLRESMNSEVTIKESADRVEYIIEYHS